MGDPPNIVRRTSDIDPLSGVPADTVIADEPPPYHDGKATDRKPHEKSSLSEDPADMVLAGDLPTFQDGTATEKKTREVISLSVVPVDKVLTVEPQMNPAGMLSEIKTSETQSKSITTASCPNTSERTLQGVKNIFHISNSNRSDEKQPKPQIQVLAPDNAGFTAKRVEINGFQPAAILCNANNMDDPVVRANVSSQMINHPSKYLIHDLQKTTANRRDLPSIN